MSTDPQERIKLAYEAYTRMVLQAAVNYIEGDEAVDRIWIYTDLGHEAIETALFFRFNGTFCSHSKIGEVDTSREYDPHGLLAEFEDEVEFELVDALREGPDFPERIITVYNPQSGELDSEWDYEDVLDPNDDRDTYGKARDRWIKQMGGKPVFSN